MTDDATKARVSSPVSTGGEGVFFEQHVGAYWLAQLLVGSIPPILTDAVVVEVHFQTEHLGLNTDDVLVVCQRAGGVKARLAVQVKRSFTVSASDDECQKAIRDYWRDLKKADPFNPATDRFLLVTLRGTNTLLEHFVGLLDASRAASDGQEFERRLSLKGFISKTSARQCAELCEIIGGLEGATVTAKDIWQFLRVLHVLSLDLHTATSQTEAHVKTLLALKSSTGDPVASAAASWNSLLAVAGSASSAARSLTRDDLPPELREAHSVVGSDEQRVLAALRSHSEFVLGKIRTAIGPAFHLRRPALLQRVLEAIESNQLVVIAGPAGSGKSVIAKEVATFLARSHFTFGFRVEEFAAAHIDATLQASQIPATATRVQAILAAQDRKLIVIESVERLLEKPTRDAFSDLMTLARADSGLGIVLTCRDYSVEQVRSSFLQPSGIGHAVIQVPPLDDDELAQIQAAFSSLALPLANPSLRAILRNPYFIDKALGIAWDSQRSVPESERDFRALFWRQIVRADDRPADGMPRRREQALEEIAVRRARALSDYVTSVGLDAAVVNILTQDSLVDSPQENPWLVATAHDVLEDWAILQWIEELHLTDQTSYRDLSLAIGAHPAVRRSFRKWVAELADRVPDQADRLFTSAVGQAEVPAQFRDDTLVSLLKAPGASEFLARHEAELIASERAILNRVIHLLRVACVTAPAWLSGMPGHSSVLNVPEGPAWSAVLQLVHRNIESFASESKPLLLAFIEDAAKGVSWWAPDLDGAEHVAGIAHWLLPRFDGYRTADLRKRTLKVLAKIPKADPVRFEAVLRGRTREPGERDHVAGELREILMSGLDGLPAARDLPDVLISVALETLLASEEYVHGMRYGGSSVDVNLNFGLKEHLAQDFPASAVRGPWTQLLAHHPNKGLGFVNAVFNHSADWYVHPRVHDRLEPAWEVELTFPDGTRRKQWVNARFWGFYRGFTVGPYVLQSLLMAVESWLLDYAKAHPDTLDATLLGILRQSDSAAVAAVVASVATANPHKSGEALLALLSVRDYVVIDRSRMANEHHAQGLSDLLPSLRAENKIYEEERKKADGLPHRQLDLEAAIANLQFGPFAARVHAVIDQHLAALPAAESRDEEDLKWQLALHRMDLRQYDLAEADVAGEDVVAPQSDGEPVKKYVRLEPRAPAPEVQRLVDEGAKTYGALNARLRVYVWGMQVFQRKSGSGNPAEWQEFLSLAHEMDREEADPDNSRNAPGFVAAVCVRDHWDEMTPPQRDWCVDVVCTEITKEADHWETVARMQRFSMAADRACANVAAALLCKPLSDAHAARVHHAFAVALTHPIDEVSWYAAWGIDATFWAANSEVALRAVNAVATEAAIVDEAWHAEETRPFNSRRAYGDIVATAAQTVRDSFWQSDAISADAHAQVDLSGKAGANATAKILAMLGQVPDHPLSLAAFMRASSNLVESWDKDSDRAGRQHRDYRQEQVISERIQHFAMRASDADASRVLQPILDSVERHTREIHNVIQGLTNKEDSEPNTEHYWFLWTLFADRVKHARWVGHLDRERPQGSEVLSTIFLTAWWKDNIRHWRSLEGHAHHVDELFEALPPSWVVLDSYVRFLYHIGERSLPAAFVRLSASLKRGRASEMLRNSNTVFMLEVLLQRYVYGRPLVLKRDPAMREAVLFILDLLVEGGSSAAFRMRDDFVTPTA